MCAARAFRSCLVFGLTGAVLVTGCSRSSDSKQPVVSDANEPVTSPATELDRQDQASPDTPDAYIERGRLRFRLAGRQSAEERLASCQSAWADFQKAYELAGGTWSFDFKPWASPYSPEGQAKSPAGPAAATKGKGSARALSEAARMCLRLFRPDLAAVLMDQARVIDPKDASVQLVCLQLEGMATGEWARVNQELKRLVESPELRENSTAWFVYGFGLMTAGDSPAAEAAYRKCLELDLDEDGARSNLVSILAAQGRMDEAAALRGELQTGGSTQIYTDMNFAVSLMGKGRFDEAIPILLSVTRRAPGLPAGWLNLGGCYLKTDHLDEAVHAYQMATTLVPEESNSLALLGYTYTRMGKFDDAVATLKHAADLPSATYSVQLALSAAYEGLGRLDEAEQALQRAWQMDHTATPVLNAYGEYLRKHDRLAELEELLSQVIGEDPGNVGAWGWRVSTHMKKGELEEALADQAKVVELAPEPSNYINYAVMLRLAEHPRDQVIANLEHALEKYEGHAYASALLWVMVREGGDDERATAEIKKAVTISEPDNWYGRIVRYLAGELGQDELLGSATEDGQRCEACYFVGEKTRLAGDAAGARNWFEKCVAVGQPNYWEHMLSAQHLEKEKNPPPPASEAQPAPEKPEP